MPPKNVGKLWSQTDIRKLKSMASTRPVGIIAHVLGRSEAAVRAKAAAESISLHPSNRSPYNRRK